MLRRIVSLVLVGTIILSTGCACPLSPSCVDFPAITRDSSGGAIAIYEVLRSDNVRDLYAQRISPEGDFLWGERGTLIDSGYKRGCSLSNLHIVDDGSGGAIIAWCEEYSGSLYLQRIGPRGGLLWHEDSTVLLGTCQRLHELTNDTLGNAFIAWVDGEYSLLAQKIDSSGELLWGQSGLLVCGRFSPEAKIIADNSGGAVLAWIYEKLGEQGGPIATPLHSQRIGPEGSISWQPEGVPVSIGPQMMSPAQPRLVSDDAGGAIIFWGSRMSIYTQRLDATGNALWSEEGIQVWDGKGTPVSPNYSVASDGSGGAIVAWNYVEKGKRGGESPTLRGQRLAADGHKLWGDDGIVVSTGIKDRGVGVAISHDGLGGALIAWGVGKYTYRPDKSYVQRIDAGGNRLWGQEGIRLDR